MYSLCLKEFKDRSVNVLTSVGAHDKVCMGILWEVKNLGRSCQFANQSCHVIGVRKGIIATMCQENGESGWNDGHVVLWWEQRWILLHIVPKAMVIHTESPWPHHCTSPPHFTKTCCWPPHLLDFKPHICLLACICSLPSLQHNPVVYFSTHQLLHFIKLQSNKYEPDPTYFEPFVPNFALK